MTTDSPLPWAEGLPRACAGWPKERQCVLHLLRTALGTSGLPADWAARIRGMNMPGLMQAIRRHRVEGFLAARLAPEIKAAFPPAFNGRLAEIAQHTQMRALRQTARLIRLADVLAAAKVPVIGMKGALLAERLYGGQGIRHAGDIDFSIAEADVARVDALLAANGFGRKHPACIMTDRRWREYTRVWRDCEYRDDGEGLTVEVMWRLANSDRLQAQVEAMPAVLQCIAGRELPVLPDTLHSLYLLVHGAHHGWFRLFWLLDIALLMRDDTVDWPAVRDLAERTGTDRAFWQGLHLAKEIFAADWPRGLAAVAPDETLRGLMDDAVWHMGLAPEQIRFGAAHVRMAAYARRLMPDPKVRERERAKRWISPDNWALLPLPDGLFPLYRISWPLLWLCRQVGRRFRGR